MTFTELLTTPAFTGLQFIICFMVGIPLVSARYYFIGKADALKTKPACEREEAKNGSVQRAVEGQSVELVGATVSAIKDPSAPPDARVKGFIYTATLRCRDCGTTWTLQNESTIVPEHGCPRCWHATNLLGNS